MKKFAIIVAGGSGTRMKSTVPKQFLLLAGKPILMHTLSQFHRAIPEMELILVLPENQMKSWENLCAEHSFSISHQLIKGGETRFHSVKNGLETFSGDGIVAVHDGVRPLLSTLFIQKLMMEAEQYGNAVPAVPVNESMRSVHGNKNTFADRSSYRLIQTPQCFQLNQLKKGFVQDYKSGFTDEANVAESVGFDIHLVEGEVRNIKITSPEDLLIAEALIANQK